MEKEHEQESGNMRQGKAQESASTRSITIYQCNIILAFRALGKDFFQLEIRGIFLTFGPKKD